MFAVRRRQGEDRRNAERASGSRCQARLWLRFLGSAALLAAGAAATAAQPPSAAAANAPPAVLTVVGDETVATVATDPWRLTVRARRGGSVLEEAAGAELGFSSVLGRRHATRVVAATREDEGWRLQVATDDPTGTQLIVRIARGPSGGVSLSAVPDRLLPPPSSFEIGFRRVPGERLLGLGERADAVDHSGREVESYVADGPYQPGAKSTLVSLFVPPWGFRGRADATYYPIPWVLSTRGIGVLVENDETVYHQLGTADAGVWSLSVVDRPRDTGLVGAPSELRLHFFAGRTPRDVLGQFTAYVGRQPPVAAPWVFGPWYQPGGEIDERVAQIRKLRAAGAPLSVAQTYTHYLPCGDQVGKRDRERAMVAALHEQGVAVTTYINPMLCNEYQPLFDEAVRSGALLRRPDGSPYLFRYTAGADPSAQTVGRRTGMFLVGQFDFSTTAGRALFRRVLDEAVADGHDGWMEDFGEYTPLDSVASDGTPGTRLHNAYPRFYHCEAYRYARAAPRPLVRFQRSGYTGAARCAQVVWSGDPTTGWGFDGLASQVKLALSAGLSGISVWGSDIGGYFALGENRLTPELLTRWVQFGAFSPVMRTQRSGFALPPRDRPQVDEPDQIANWARYAAIHNRLYPYLLAADREYQRSGMPIVRHLALAYPDDAQASAQEDEYLFGPDLLVAPVLAPGARSRRLYVPPGTWIDLWRSVAVGERPGVLRLERPRLLDGARAIEVPAPLAEIPLLVRAGALIPLLSPDVETLAPYGRGRVVGLRERADRLELLAFPRGSSSRRFLEDGFVRSTERRSGWRLEIAGKRTRSYLVRASLATLRRPFTPCRVLVSGRVLPPRNWRWLRSKQSLELRVRARRAVLSVRPCR